MSTKTSFINDARQIVQDYFVDCAPYEATIERAAAGRRSGVYTQDFESATRVECENAMSNLRSNALLRLAELQQEFSEDLTKRACPSGAEMNSADYNLLRSGLPITAAEFCAICERNDGNETVLRAAGEYAASHNLTPYFRKYYKTPAERLEAFGRVIETARRALAAQRPYCCALDPKHWECVTAADAKIIGSSVEYYNGKAFKR